MNPSYQRALILFQQNRFADAERELRASLAVSPHDPQPHAMLALCILRRPNKDARARDEAMHEADYAVGLAPHEPFAHYVRAKVLYDRNRLAEAEAAIGEAIRLDPHHPDYFWTLGAIRFEQQRWADALWAAEQGLAAEPEHAGCVNLRAMALVKLGRTSEAGAAIGAALARDPEDAYTHANQGWTLLQQGQHERALEHFREALRLNPELEWARAGIVEALKARYLIYRLMLRYFLFMGRLGARAQWAFVIGGYVAYRALAGAAENNPALAPYVWPVMGAYIAFAVMTWLADPLFNLLLRLNRFGRLALSRHQLITSNIVGGLLLAAIGCAAAWLFVVRDARLLILALVLGLMLLPTSGIFKVPDGWPRVVMMVACCVLLLVGLGAVGAMFSATAVEREWGDAMIGLGGLMLTAFSYGVLFTTIGFNWLRSVRPVR